MKAEAQERQERSPRGVLGVWLCWIAVAIMLYVLSVGPVMKITIMKIGSIPTPVSQFLIGFYKPLEWAYNNTLLHRPLGMYYHLWIPSVIDGHRNTIRKS